MTRSAGRTPARMPQGIGPVGQWLAPAISLIGLIVVALITINLLQGGVPFVGGSSGNGNGNGGPIQTAAPSNVVVVPDVVSFKGSIVYAKEGNIWVQEGKDARQLTTGGSDTMPSWAPDGSAIYFIRTVDGMGRWPSAGVDRDYILSIPNIMRVTPDGGDRPVQILNGKVNKAGRTWHAWTREPVLSPDGKTLAFVSDRPDPSLSDVILQFYNIDSKKSTIPSLPETPPLGHQDPVWRPDGAQLLYVRNGRNGTKGAPVIYRWDVAKATARALTGPGYLEPSYSPDGRYVVATKTNSFGSDLVILDGGNGRELMRLTNDGLSWAGDWSPAGDAIAFMHIRGGIVDLNLIRLEGAGPSWTIKDVTSLTEVSGLDGESRPDWFIPADQLPPPTPAPTVVPTDAPSPS